MEKKLIKFNDFLDRHEISYSQLIRAMIYVVCCSVMVYQVSIVCIDYYSYPTVVQISIKPPEKDQIPSISVCRQMKTTDYLNLVIKAHPNFAAKYNITPLQSPQKPNTVNTTEEKEDEMQTKALELLSNYFNEPDKNAKTFFELISHSLKVECVDVRHHEPVTCELKRDRINSFTQKRICVTFYSQLYININDSDNALNISMNISQKVDDSEMMLAWLKIENPGDDIYVNIHTSESMPDINLYDIERTRSRVFKNKTYGLIYNKFTTVRLEWPYQTNCNSYVRARKEPDDPLSEFGCIGNCKKDYWKLAELCIPIDLVFVNESGDKIFPICNCTAKDCDITLNKCNKCQKAKEPDYKQYAKNCEDNCKQDCHEEYFQKEMFELREDYRNVIWQKQNITQDNLTADTTIVFIAAKYMEQLRYTHSPKMGQFDFFAAFGGLFSLWVGASVLTIYDLFLLLFNCVKTLKKEIDHKNQMFYKRQSICSNKVILDKNVKSGNMIVPRYDKRMMMLQHNLLTANSLRPRMPNMNIYY